MTTVPRITQGPGTVGMESQRHSHKEQTLKPTTHDHDRPARRMSVFSNRSNPSDGPSLLRVGGDSRRKKSLSQAMQPLVSLRRFSKAIGSKSSDHDRLPKFRFMENTYRTEPVKGTEFSSAKAQVLIAEILKKYLNEVTYEPEVCRELVTLISSELNRKMRDAFPLSRYKFVCNVVIGQQKNQGLEMASRSLWNAEHDKWVHSMFTNNTLFAIGVVHALYFE